MRRVTGGDVADAVGGRSRSDAGNDALAVVKRLEFENRIGAVHSSFSLRGMMSSPISHTDGIDVMNSAPASV